MMALQIIQTNFTRNSSDNPAGTAKLTLVSTTIGGVVHRHIKREPVPWNMEVRIGDLFIEAFYNNGFVDIEYPKIRDSSYTLQATEKWEELAEIPAHEFGINIKNSVTEMPADITGLMQAGRERPLIKDRRADSHLDTDKPYVRAINKLQQTGWKINRPVLKAILENKELFASSVPIEDNEPKEIRRRSKALEYKFITAKAELLQDAEAFYQYMEADYRGRLYYAEPFLNFQGSDLARASLLFAEGKPMDSGGLFWLAVHTAASFNMSYNIDEIPEWAEADYKTHLETEGLESISVDKFTLEDRVRWTNEYMERLIDAGETGSIFADAEKPVSVLAACIEWFEYERATSAGREYVSHLPIPVDGSNNGWQHLGAMSKDPRTGELVGLKPVGIQRDFYVSTAKELYGLTTDERLLELLNSMPMKHIRKGISKRGSMTRAYSAGANKIGENMWFDCRAEEFHDKYGIEEKDCMKFAKILIKAIDNVCPGPLHTMGYLQELAKYKIGEYKKFGPDGEPAGAEYKTIVARQKELYVKKDKSEDELLELSNVTKAMQAYESKLTYGEGADRIEWLTPSGFEVEYVNFIQSSRKCRGTISGYKTKMGKAKTINHVSKVDTKNPDVRGFMCGISPNFIHSLDASHMALVIDDWDGQFGAVHDSFSTHACDVEELLVKTKSVFVNMYDVENYFDIIRWRLTQDEDNIKQPELGNLNIQEVHDSDYFFA